ncbi:serine hydrolase domain-containing protein [Actinophytocola oryzae]|uniref:D-alanyl-D-alanine carboxypeptidase n=1 Tax=Actinophytocola oryzae TaxID=502181 RepID=A0A4R7VQM8_9PSEU|nr:serine hydrolase domain-containing protein [Actinophytocola oryzae]TDV52056.1 D-alanyl-D-alanine carboxypeptidase [Actinophytocola oryzae]
MLRKLGLAAVAVTLTACAAPTEETVPPQRVDAVTVQKDTVQRSLDALVGEDDFPGALAAVRSANGRTRDYVAGVGDLRTGAPVPPNGYVRIASNTKMFTATVVLQLVGEGKVGLDEPIETYLPGVVRGDGIDGHDISVRQLLQHTSGLPDYDEIMLTDYLAVRHTYFEPRQMVDAALTRPALSAPGTGWSYSNTNYVLAGLMVQQVTGRPLGEEITRRVIEPLGLRETYWPEAQTIRGRHPHGYWPGADGRPVDVTEMDPSPGWAAGQLVGTPRDLNTFLTGLLDGDLLAPAQLAEMKELVDAPDFDTTGTARYGLGLATFQLSCGGVAWTHGGNAPGYITRNAVAENGRAATIAVTGPAMNLPAAEHVEDALDTALCA